MITQSDNPMLQGLNLKKQIGDSVIFEGVNLEVRPSEIACLIGPSGSGKSSALNCLAMLDTPTAGTVAIDGQQFRFDGPPPDNLSEFHYPTVTVVFQGLFLWPHLTNEQNILLPQQGRKTDLALLEDLIERLKLRSLLHKFPNECSGGERQRVALVRQMLLEPKYLLLDEITSALDLETITAVSEILTEFKINGTGILLITHMINLAKHIGDRFFFLDKGKIVETGEIAGLLNPETVRLREFLQIYS